MPFDSTTITDRAQLLFREIGPERIQQYVEQRLSAGPDLPTRHLLIRIYAQLVGEASGALVLKAVQAKDESVATRSAAIAILADLFDRFSSQEFRSEVTATWTAALNDSSQEVRSAAATALTRHKVDQAVPLLQSLIDKDLLDPVVEEITSQFARESRALAVGQIVPDVEDFLIRRHDLDSLNKLLSSHLSSTLCITGMAGVGKTTLAAYYARQSDHELKFWLSGSRYRDLAESAQDMLRQAYLQGLAAKGSPLTRPYPEPFDWSVTRHELIQLLSDKSALLVIDDLDASRHPEELTQFITSLTRALPRLQCLLTSRRVVRQSQWQILRLDALTEDKATEYLLKILRERNVTVEPSMVTRLLEVGQGSPLLLKLAVEYMNRRELSESSRLGRDPDILIKALDTSFRDLTRSQRRLLEILAQFESASLKLDDAELLAILHSEQIDQQQLLETLEILERNGLILRRENGTFSFYHLLIKEYVRQRTDQRTALRVNRTLANYYRKGGEILTAARHYLVAGDHCTVVDLIVDVLASIINQGHAREALQILNDTEPNVRSNEPQVRLRLLATKGHLSSLLGNPEDSLSAFEAAVALATELGDQNSQASSQLSLATEYARRGQWDRAMELNQQSLGLCTGIRDELGVQRAKLGLAEVSMHLGRWDEAVELYRSVLQSREVAGHESRAAEIYNNLGLIYFSKGEPTQALEMYERSLASFARSGEVRFEAQIYNNLGLVYADLGRYDQALAAYERGLALSQQVEDVAAVARTYQNIGSVHAARGESGRAIEMYQRSLATKQRLGDAQGTAQVLVNLAGLYAAMGEIVRAVETYNQSLALFQDLGDVRSIAVARANLGLTYFTMGETQQAEQSLLIALQSFEQLGDVLNQAYACANLGNIYASLGLVDRAADYYARAYSFLIRSGHSSVQQVFEALVAVLGTETLAEDFLRTHGNETSDHSPILTGSGAIAQSESVAVGQRSVAIGGNVGESVIVTGDANIVVTGVVGGEVKVASRDTPRRED